MKKCITAMLTLTALLLLFSCGEPAGTETAPPPSPCEEALAYIDSGEVEMAFYTLRALADAGDAEAQSALADFKSGWLSRSETSPGGGVTLTANSYDAGGNLTSSAVTYSDGRQHTCDYTYEGDTLRSELHTYQSEDTLTRTYTYDEAGRVLTLRGQSSAGSVYEYAYSYDGEGRLALEIYSDADGEHSRREYTYTEGKLTREVCAYAVGERDEIEYSWDKNGNLVKKRQTYTGGRSDTYTYTYDEAGNVTSELIEYSDGSSETLTHAYTYDTRGNLITETHTYPDGETKTVTYFDYRVFYKGE